MRSIFRCVFLFMTGIKTKFRLKKKEYLSSGMRRIANEQMDRAVYQLTESEEPRDEALHDARKSFKKIRAVLRLLRSEIGDSVYKHENICFRDAGRKLSGVRDSAVMLDTMDLLSKKFKNGALSEIKETLLDRKNEAETRVFEDTNAREEVVGIVRAARFRVADWPIKKEDFSAIGGGLRRVYKRGRNRWQDASGNPTTENLHEWRKQVKYLWYHMRVLQTFWPKGIGGLADSLHDLSDYLGDDHDLAELKNTLAEIKIADDERLMQLSQLIDERRSKLQSSADPLGERIYYEKPSAFVDRMEAYWAAGNKV